ncbi:hypothetical protein ACFL3D_01445 [Candidatus Omnitrophota bacterium]
MRMMESVKLIAVSASIAVLTRVANYKKKAHQIVQKILFRLKGGKTNEEKKEMVSAKARDIDFWK